MRSRGYAAAFLAFFFILSLTALAGAAQAEEVAKPEIKYIKRMYVSFVYLEGERSFIPGIKAAQHSLIYNNDGIDPKEGLNTYLGFDLEWGASKPVSLYFAPLFTMEDGVGAGEFKKAFIKFSFRGLDLDIGKRDLWWGQGKHGGLFLTNNAEPLTMVRLTNPVAASLPWLFRYLGPFRFDTFVSRLEDDRDVPEPWFAGMRFTFSPHRAFEIGLTRTIIMGGEGRPGMTPARLWDIAFGENKVLGEELSNSLAGVDVRLTLPSFELYGELGGEDEAGGFPSKAAYIAGLYIPKLKGGIDLRVEYADLRNKAWYVHALYSSGYTYNGRILGHHVGGGGSDLFVEMGILDTERLKAGINFDYEQRSAASKPAVEKHYQLGTTWSYRISRAAAGWTLGAGLYLERIENARYNPGEERDNALVSINITGNL